MQDQARGIASELVEAPRRARPVWASLGTLARRNPLGVIGFFFSVTFVLMAIFAPVLAPRDPYHIDQKSPLKAPSATYWLGTDNLGRDVLSRVIHGARISVTVGFLAVLIGISLGSAIGIVGAYFGGKVDLVIQRIMDAMMSFPTLIFALVLVSVLRPSIFNVILAIGILEIPRSSRVIRSQALSVKSADYITAAKALGASAPRILWYHILPQCMAPIFVLASLYLPQAIITESSLSFLGLGVPAPAPSWGNMLSEAGRQYLEIAPWIAIAPGIAISLAVFGFNMLGDTMRDILDPRLRGSR